MPRMVKKIKYVPVEVVEQEVEYVKVFNSRILNNTQPPYNN
jgi:hypothetical protein